MKNSSFSHAVLVLGWLAMLAAGMAPQIACAQFYDPIFGPAFGPPVRIVSPANHAVFYSSVGTPLDIPIFAYTRSEARFTNVEFYATGTNSLGSYVHLDLGPGANLSSTNRTVIGGLPWSPVMGPTVLGRLTALWCVVWSNAPAGNYALTAVAKGNELLYQLSNVNRTSAPVNITILSSTNGTNPTNIVSIVATDPVAIAGTNCYWVWPGLTNAVPSWTNWPPPHWSYFTNWGPKAALFTVRRFGDASSNLTVNYKIGGTASNGVDYVALPGTVGIPAGGAYALIPIMPIDNGSNRLAKSVILTLTTNSTQNYRVGVPPCAEAVIYYAWPRPVPLALASVPPLGGFLPDGSFHFNATGPDGAWVAIQNSADLASWSSVGTNQMMQGSIDFLDPNATGNAAGFYRLVPQAGPPAP